MDRITKTLADLFPDVLSQSNNKTRHSHFHDLSVIRHTVESGMDQKSALAEYRIDVE